MATKSRSSNRKALSPCKPKPPSTEEIDQDKIRFLECAKAFGIENPFFDRSIDREVTALKELKEFWRKEKRAPSSRTLAKRTGMDSRAVLRALNRLVKKDQVVKFGGKYIPAIGKIGAKHAKA